MNHKDKALRIAFVAFRKMSLGTKFSPEELLTLSDLMGIALPVKHRLTKAELRMFVWDAVASKASAMLTTAQKRKTD